MNHDAMQDRLRNMAERISDLESQVESFLEDFPEISEVFPVFEPLGAAQNFLSNARHELRDASAAIESRRFYR